MFAPTNVGFHGMNALIGVISKPLFYNGLRMVTGSIYLLHSEQDILKLVTALIANTKGEGRAGDDFWVKAETLLYTALIAYIHYEAPVEN